MFQGMNEMFQELEQSVPKSGTSAEMRGNESKKWKKCADSEWRVTKKSLQFCNKDNRTQIPAETGSRW